MKRVAAACLVGSTIELYDFLIYGTAAALVFPTVFFPHLGAAMATTASMGTFAAAFLSRPLGAVVFGHFGDRLGRKKTLVATLLIMALSTVGVGLVPSTAAIGVTAPLILIGLRLLQGIALGGEWTGSALPSAEYAPTDKRGRYGMFTALGGRAALVLACVTFLGVNYTIGEHSPAFMQWGWRLPFVISAPLIGVGLYVRLKIGETPVFAEEKARNLVPKAPLAELLRLQRRQIALAAGSGIAGASVAYMASTYLVAYANTRLGYSRNIVLLTGVLDGLTVSAFIVFSAILCDRVGRRRMILIGWAACLPWSFVVIPLIDTGRPFCLRRGYRRHTSRGWDCLRAYGSLPPRAVRDPLPLLRNGVGDKPRWCCRWRRAAADRRHAAGDLRQLGGRPYAGHHRRDQPGMHLSAARNQQTITA
jgi:MFS family permease